MKCHQNIDRRHFFQASACVAAGLLGTREATAADFAKPSKEAAGLTSYLKDGSLQLRYDNLPLLGYRAQPSLKYPYFYPLNGPASGLSLTTESALPYPHHRGLWLGCDPLNGGNYWADNGLESGQIKSLGLKLETDNVANDAVAFTERCSWVRGETNPIDDERRYTLARPDERRVLIDCEFKLHANEDISIKRAKHSFFAMRAAADISPTYGGTLFNSAGGINAAGTYGKPADWCGYFGKRRLRPDVVEGIAIMNHPENFGGDCPWFTRDYGHLSPS
ncbi:MAG: PmoA family protein, partial [Pirellulaceae bacterium]|nr:PmoA family protein [Pirellulaceae bacterium]